MIATHAPKTAATIPMSAPNIPATTPNRAAPIANQIGKVTMSMITSKMLEVLSRVVMAGFRGMAAIIVLEHSGFNFDTKRPFLVPPQVRSVQGNVRI